MSQSSNYASRSEIGGSSLVVDRYATLRGNVRRLDPDGGSHTEPYFQGLDLGGTLVVSASGTVVNVTITGSSIAQVLADLNAALSPNARAFDDGGCIAIQATAIGDAGFLEITSGSALAPLGFDASFGNLVAHAGNITSGPEARAGNSDLVGFLAVGEGLTTRSVNRALTRLATNADILHASQKAPKLKVRQVGLLAASSQSVSGSYGIIPLSSFGSPSPDLFTGLGQLDASSSADELEAYYSLFDNTTGRASASKVVAVAVGAISGAPPYVDATQVSGIGNALGRSLRRVGPITITSILHGNLIRAAPAAFSSVRLGDLAYIELGANTSQVPWGNVKEPWVVVQKGVDPNSLFDQIKVRPLSDSERTTLGLASTFASRTSLNAYIEAGQDFGNIRFETGFFVNADVVRFVVSPPLAGGSTVRVYGPVKSLDSDFMVGDEQSALYPVHKRISDEVTRATDAESTLSSNITTERNRAMAAESAEQSRAQAAEAALAAADLTPTQKSTLTTGANADSLHTHANTGAAANHTHPESDIIGLATDLANRSLVGHGHSQNDVTGLVSALSGKSNVGHGHAISDVTSLQSTLDGKAPAVHLHYQRAGAVWAWPWGGPGGGHYFNTSGLTVMRQPFVWPAGTWRTRVDWSADIYTGWGHPDNWNVQVTFYEYSPSLRLFGPTQARNSGDERFTWGGYNEYAAKNYGSGVEGWVTLIFSTNNFSADMISGYCSVTVY